MTFWHKLRHWPIVTLTYIEKFDSVSATTQINLPDVHTMTFGHKLRHWPIVTLTYIEKKVLTLNMLENKSIYLSTLFTFPFTIDVQPMIFGHKLRHWPIITRTYIEKFDSVTATGQINLPAGCQKFVYFLSFPTLMTSSGQLYN